MPFSVGKGCVFCCSLLVCGAFISAADTFITANHLRNCGGLVRVSAPCAALAFIVGTSHHNGAKTLLARVGATAAQFVVAAPSGTGI